MTRRLVAATLGLTLVVGLTACGSSDSGAGGSEGAAKATTSTQVAGTTGGGSTEKATYGTGECAPAEGVKEPVLTFKDHMQQVRALAWSPNGKRVASCDDSCILVWDALTGSNVDIYRGKSLSYTLAWSPDSQLLAASLDGTTIQIWQAE